MNSFQFQSDRQNMAFLLNVSRSKIIGFWEERIRNEIPPAGYLKTSVLQEQMSRFLDEIQKALAVSSPNLRICSDQSVYLAHASSRAEIAQYTVDQVIYEYVILRQILFEEIISEKFVNNYEINIILDIIEYGIRFSVGEFFRIHSSRVQADEKRMKDDRSKLLALARMDLDQFREEREIREKFVLTLTHDLRTPLTAAKMNAELLLLDHDLVKFKETMIKGILSNIERVNVMIQDLLDANQIRVGKAFPLHIREGELREIIQNTVKELSIIHDNRLVLNAGEDIVGYWDKNAIRRVLENLIDNAVKYGDSKTPITVGIKSGDEWVQISVHNYGRGLSPEEQSHLFEPFQRTRSAEISNKKGWGLGLSLVKGIIEAHGGQVRISSSADTGTTFFIDLPKDARVFQK